MRLLRELMAAAALPSATVRLDGAIVMQMQGSGPVQLVVVERTQERTVLSVPGASTVLRPQRKLSGRQ
jgi:molecular chaperone Hsp33